MPGARKRFFTALTGIAAALALVVAPAVATGASATELKGKTGKLVEWTAESNHETYWEQDYGLPHDADCVKVDGANSTAYGIVGDDGLTLTLKPFDPALTGDHWELLVVKAGNLWNNVIVHPEVGVAYASPVNNGGQQAVISHWFLCSGTSDQPPADVKVTTTTTIACEPPLATVITTTSTTSFVLDPTTKKWVAEEPRSESVTTTRELTAAELATCDEPEQPVTTTEVVRDRLIDGVWECGDTTVEQTQKVTTTTYVDGVAGEPVVTTETTVRDLLQAEIGELCPLLPGTVLSECVGDVPYLGYEVSLPEGFTTEDENPVTITFLNELGDVYVVPGTHGLTGRILWPGASDGEPKMWPGWKLEGGVYVKTTDNFDWTRNGVTVRFEVNPTVEVQVEYPEATALCANPAAVPTFADPFDPSGDPSDPADPAKPASLAVTGSTVQGGVIGLGALALVAGIAMSIVSARRRAKA